MSCWNCATACGCLTVTGAIALLHEQGYRPFGQFGSGGELLANGEAAAAVWPAPPDRIAAVQFGTMALGPAHQQPAGRVHRDRLANHPATDPAAQPEVFELVYPLWTRRQHSTAVPSTPAVDRDLHGPLACRW